MNTYQISDHEFHSFQQLIYDIAGISLSDAKKILLTGRLAKRLNALGLGTYTQYFRYVTQDENREELQFMVDLLTTNETYFFREPQHFDFLKTQILPRVQPGQAFRLWSAASSNGAEAYSAAMVLADQLGERCNWDVFGSDISNSVLERARRGHYPMEEAARIPPAYLKKYCLKGTRNQAGTFMIDGELRRRVRFEQVNLITENMRKPGEFDVIFLRNVMIYFDMPTKKRVIENLIPCLKRGGTLIVGHAESLNGVTTTLAQLKPTIYQRA
jgi:chemotaxis protein methyltransferase CheR